MNAKVLLPCWCPASTTAASAPPPESVQAALAQLRMHAATTQAPPAMLVLPTPLRCSALPCPALRCRAG